MRNWRRYEILLPLRFNEGQRVPKSLLAQTVHELEDERNAGRTWVRLQLNRMADCIRGAVFVYPHET